MKTKKGKITGDAKTVIFTKVKALSHESFKYKDSFSKNILKSFNTNILKNKER